MKDKEKKMIFGIGIVFLFLATVGFSYAYFTANITNKDVKDQVVETGTLQLTYTDGPEIVMNNIKPGTSITKEVSVKNTGTLDTAYNLVWQELANEIINDEMVIEATCTRLNANGVEEGTCESLSRTPIKRIKVKENVSIEANITHKYNITITFKETNADQNYNQGKSFTGTLGVNEYVENTPIYCTFDGDMVQGAEYVNGQYTYRYMQQSTGSWDENSQKVLYSWENIDTDGWGVQLTNRDSADPITTKLCTYINNKPIVSMVNMFSNSQSTAIDLSSFNTSNVTNMDGMFAYSKATSLDLSSFDTKNVTNMSYMFDCSLATALDLSSFNTSNVTDMTNMFYYSNATALNVNNFDTSNVKNMSYMFAFIRPKVLDLSNFDTRNVTNMVHMFDNTQITNLDLSSFDTSNVIRMDYMFYEAKNSNINFSSFNTSNVTNMSYMFSGITGMKVLDVSNFNTNKVTDMNDMFWLCEAIQIKGIENFNTSNVIDMSSMFSNSKVTNLNLSSFDTSNVTDMRWMFNGTIVEKLDVSNFDTSNVIRMDYMFQNTSATEINGLENFNTSNVKYMYRLFYNSKLTILDLSSFDTSKVIDMREMLSNMLNLQIIYISDKFITTKAISHSDMFKNSTNLVGGAGTKYDDNYVDKTYARVDGGTSSPGYFTLKSN